MPNDRPSAPPLAPAVQVGRVITIVAGLTPAVDASIEAAGVKDDDLKEEATRVLPREPKVVIESEPTTPVKSAASLPPLGLPPLPGPPPPRSSPSMRTMP